MVAKNCKYDRFRHVHFVAILKRNDRPVGPVEIIIAFVDGGVEKNATGPGKSDSSFQFGISGRNGNRWEGP